MTEPTARTARITSVIDPESADGAYGSDAHGLVWGFLVQPGAAGTAITSDQGAAWLDPATPAAPGAFIWLHFSLSNSASERWLRERLSLPESFFGALAEHAGSTHLEQDGEALVGVVHDALFEFTLDPESIASVALYLSPRVMITVRLRPVRSVDLLRTALRSGQRFRSTAELVAELLRYQAEVLVKIVRSAATKVDLIEDNLLAGRISASRRDLGLLRRTLVRLQRLLAPEPAAMFRLLSRSPAWIGATDLQEMRQAAEEFSTAIAESTTLVERVKLLQEELSALVGEQTGRTLFVLTIVTVLALPINLVAGLFGMNVGGIPFAEHRQGFFLVVGGLSLLTAVAAYLALGRKRE